MKMGIQELLLVFIVALVVLGPDKLPVYAKKLGSALAQFRKFSEDATKDIRESIVEPLEEAQRPLREAMEPVTEFEKDVRENVNEIKQSLNSIGKPSTRGKESSGAKTDVREAAAQTGEGADVKTGAEAEDDVHAQTNADDTDVPAQTSADADAQAGADTDTHAQTNASADAQADTDVVA